MITPESIDRLKSQLLTSGLSQRDQPLYQIINQLIDASRQTLTGIIDFTPQKSIPISRWVTVPHNASDFTGDASAWTVDAGDLNLFKYTIIDKTMIVCVSILGSSVGAGNSQLRVLIPNGQVIAGVGSNFIAGTPFYYFEAGGVWTLGHISLQGGQNTIDCQRVLGGSPNWTPVTNGTNVLLTVMFEIP